MKPKLRDACIPPKASLCLFIYYSQFLLWEKKEHSGWNGADLKLNPAKTGFVFFLNQKQPDLSFLYKTDAITTICIWIYMVDARILGGSWEPI